MRNIVDEDYFFTKYIRIGVPMSRIIQAFPEFEFASSQKINADIRFSSISPSTGRPQPFGHKQGYAPAPHFPRIAKNKHQQRKADECEIREWRIIYQLQSFV